MNEPTSAPGAATDQYYRQSQQSLENYTMQLAILEEQERMRKEGNLDGGHAQRHNGQPSNRGDSTTARDQQSDAVQQYYRMLREEQARRNRELGRPK